MRSPPDFRVRVVGRPDRLGRERFARLFDVVLRGTFWDAAVRKEEQLASPKKTVAG